MLEFQYAKEGMGRDGILLRMCRATVLWERMLLMRLGPNGEMLDQDQLEEYVRHMLSVHYEAKVDGVQDGGYCQDVYLVSSSDTTPAETEVAGE